MISLFPSPSDYRRETEERQADLEQRTQPAPSFWKVFAYILAALVSLSALAQWVLARGCW